MPDFKRFMIRIPDDVHEQLKAWAKEEDRSLHSLLIWIIRRALKEFGK